MAEAATLAPKYQETEEWKALKARHDKAKEKGEIHLIEIVPVDGKRAFGGITILDTHIRDKYKNNVLDMSDKGQRLGFGPLGATLRLDDENDLPFIYAIFHCPIVKTRLLFEGDSYRKLNHQFRVIDQQATSEAFAETRQEDIHYQNQFYKLGEDIINFLCTVAKIDTTRSLSIKRSELCQRWDLGRKNGGEQEVMRKRIKEMMDSPDLEYFRAAYDEVSKGNPDEQKGFYKTRDGIYKYNSKIIGTSIENVVAYLKGNDDIYVALRKIKSPEGKKVKPE